MALENYNLNTADPDAADVSARARETVLRRLADLALLPSTLISPQERSILDSALASIAGRFDEATRRRIAERLAQQVDAPRELALALAVDHIDVARPLLEDGLGLKGGDLVQIIREGGDAHRLVLAGRKDITSDVADVLIELGDTELICRLLANKMAALSLRAVETLVRRSAVEPEFQAPLLARPELTVRLAQLMFWWVPSPMRLEILNRFTVERRHIHSALDEETLPPMTVAAMDSALQAALSVLKRPAVIDKARLGRLLGQTPTERPHEFADELARLGRLRPETMFRILNDNGGEPLAVFAKASGMSRKEFGDLIVSAVEMRRGGVPTKADLERIGELFDTISTDRADMALHCWDATLASEA